MPTDIYFAGENLPVQVDEDPGQVVEAFTSSDGHPVRLTRQGGRDEVYINPAMVAYWSASQPGSGPEPPLETPQRTTTREAVTDVWGNPVSKKRRR